jgi:CDP-diacylglycerol--glycerol-3-phosphate 3-phosphatidyltransferase
VLKARFGVDFDARLRRALPFFFHPRVHPNALTAAGTLICLGGAAAFACGELVWGGLVTALGSLFDLVDGVVARHQGRASAFGAFLDSSLDRVVDMALLLGLGLHYARGGSTGLALLAGLALVGSVMTSYTKARAELWLRDFHGGWMERAERIVLLILGGVTGLMPFALALVALGSVATALQRVHLAYRRLAAMASEAPR